MLPIFDYLLGRLRTDEGSGGSDPNSLGYFVDATALTTAYPAGDDGNFAIVGSTDTVWVWDSGTAAWVDTGNCASGDMLAAVYDPTNVAGDAFDMDNMVEGAATKIMTDTERTKLSGIEAGADVTDAANVTAALVAAALPAVTPAGGDKVVIKDLSAGDAISTVTIQSILDLAQLTATHTVYVAKTGNDSNTGLAPNVPKLTIQGAVTVANTLISGGASGVRIDVLDAGTYQPVSTVAIASNVHLIAPAATIIGPFTVAGLGTIIVDKHYALNNSEVMLDHGGGTAGAAFYYTRRSDGRGVGGALTGVKNVTNSIGVDKVMVVDIGILFVGASGVGIGDVTSGNGHIHIKIADLYLAGASAIGLLGNISGGGNDTNIVGFIDHILETGSHASTVGISMVSAGAIIKLVCAEIVADTAYSISAGSLHLCCPKITGAVSGTPVNLMLGTINLPATTQVLFNNAGALGGSSNLTWDNINNRLSLTGELRLPLLNSGGKLLATDTDGDVIQSDIEFEAAPAGGSGLILEEYASAPVSPPTGMVWIEAVDGTTKKLCYWNGTDTFSVDLSV